ncbi:hypothetical protein [uncultured Tateyamaria sp.]|uniref:hypothetical protein n=1 Tax=uncultured Tateyamaria sp. TaxID=455651 RepID=UPI002612B1E3|nr:hypothetical protein [uncultured Tateyamaria sp.]
MTRSLRMISFGIMVGLATGSFSPVFAQDQTALSSVDLGVSVRLEGLASEARLASYTIETQDGRAQLDIQALAEQVLDLGLEYRSDDFLEAVLQTFPRPDVNDNQFLAGMEGIASALRDGGMHALAAEEILAFVQGSANCLAAGGVMWPQDADGAPRPRLIRSEMDLHFNIGELPNGSNFGRGQFDVASIKLLMCVVPETPADSYPIIVDRRWVINVGDGALIARTDQRFPPSDPSAPVYPYRLSAQGNGIELVSYYVSGVRQPRTDPIYKTSPNACIDIFFNIVPVPDQPVMISKPGDLVFCAGGACGNRPPRLDATH